MSTRLLGAVLAAVVLLCGHAHAGLAGEAEEAYAAQRYDVAIAKLEAIVDSGIENENVYYDLGNAYFLISRHKDPELRANKLGRAILAYERALRLAPDFEDARYNLEVAREHAAARFGKDTVVGAARDPLWMRAVHWLPMQPLVWAFLALDALFFAVLIAVRFLNSGFLRTGLIVGDVFVGLAGACLGVLLFGQIYYREHVRMSVIVADEVTMREGPDPTRREMPRLHAGLRVVIVREQGGWALVRLANRAEGWIVKEAVEEI